jgi:glycine oxidase
MASVLFFIFGFGRESVHTHWPHILAAVAPEIYFRHCGSIVLAHPHDQVEWIHFTSRIASQLDLETAQTAWLQQLDHDALMQLEPALAKFETAYYFPDEAHFDCQALMSALKVWLQAENIQCRTNTTVLALAPGEIVTTAGSATFDMVFDCRGMGATAVFHDLRALRGELMWLYAPDVQLQRPLRLLHPRYSLYIVPRPDNMYLIGASEIEADDHSAVSVRSALELLTAAYYVHAGFAEARIIQTVVHCRPTLANHLPRIKYTDGLLAVNGLYRHGYLLAPALCAEIVRGLADKQSNGKQQCLLYPEIWEN